MLKRLYIDNYRCLTNFELRPGQVAVLGGLNGAGKSTVLDALRSVRTFLGTGGTVTEQLPQWSRTRWDTRLEQRFELDIEDQLGTPFRYVLEVRHDPEQRDAVIQEERLTSGSDLLYRLVGGEVYLYGDDASPEPRTTFPFAPRRSFLPVLEARPDNRRITAFKQWLAGMWLFSLRPHALDATSLEESDSLHETGGNFVSWYRSLVQTRPELAETLRDDLAPVIPGLNAPPKVIKTGRDARVLVLECAGASGKTFSLGVNELSDGQRALLVLYSVLRALAPFTSLLVFDEPDNFVAQTEIQPWLAAMREAVVNAKNGTLLVLSHHPEVIDYLAADQVLYLWRGGDGPTRVRELSIDREQGLTASESIKLGLADAG